MNWDAIQNDAKAKGHLVFAVGWPLGAEFVLQGKDGRAFVPVEQILCRRLQRPGHQLDGIFHTPPINLPADRQFGECIRVDGTSHGLRVHCFFPCLYLVCARG